MSWKDKPDVCPTFTEIVTVLHDEGVATTTNTKLFWQTGIKHQKFVKIAKIATQIHKKLKEHFNPATLLDDNVSHGKDTLAVKILQSRKHVDTCDADRAFHSYGKEGRVYLIHNHDCPMYAGIDLVIKRFQEAHEHNVKSRASNQTPEDGLRLAGVLFNSEHRAAVAGVMMNKKDQKKSDAPGDTTKNFFSVALKDFMDPNFEVVLPREELWFTEHTEEERDKWNPNNPAIFKHSRIAEWLCDTWLTYVKPWYKKALDKWNKDTGGGDGAPLSFIDFCKNDRWLVWIFLNNYDASFLLANNTSGQMSNHMHLEPGFDNTTISDIMDDNSKSALASCKKMKAFEKQLSEIKDSNDGITDLTMVIVECFQSKMTPKPSADASKEEESDVTPVRLSYNECLKRACLLYTSDAADE